MVDDTVVLRKMRRKVGGFDGFRMVAMVTSLYRYPMLSRQWYTESSV